MLELLAIEEKCAMGAELSGKKKLRLIVGCEGDNDRFEAYFTKKQIIELATTLLKVADENMEY